MAANVGAILLLLYLTGALFLGRPFLVRRIQIIFWLSVATIGLALAYQAAQLYFSWLTDAGAGRYLLPPYTSINYYLFYAGIRIFLPYLLALAFAGIAFLTTKYTNKNFNERFFYPEEYYFLALGIFLTGHPFWLGYIILACIVYLIYAVISASSADIDKPRVSLYYFWLPLALAVSAATPLLKTIPLLSIFRLS